MEGSVMDLGSTAGPGRHAPATLPRPAHGRGRALRPPPAPAPPVNTDERVCELKFPGATPHQDGRCPSPTGTPGAGSFSADVSVALCGLHYSGPSGSICQSSD